MQKAAVTEAEIMAATALREMAEALTAYTGHISTGQDTDSSWQQELSYTSAKSMHDAAVLAATRCAAWRIDEENNVVDSRDLLYLAYLQDGRLHLLASDDSICYLVNEEGSIGLTADGCRSIEWIFLAEETDTD